MSTATTLLLRVAKEFSPTPGARCREDGDFSGELFRDKVLVPWYKQAKQDGAILFIDLDETGGYGTSFLEEAFGGLARLFPDDNVAARIQIKSEDEPYLKDDIAKYIKEANDK